MGTFRILLAAILCLFHFAAHAREAKQDARIGHLISSIETLNGSNFLRNGKEYAADAAAAHLRQKLGRAGERVKTAEDFIEGLASKSSISGKPYVIRKADKTIVTTRKFLYARLKEYDKGHP